MVRIHRHLAVALAWVAVWAAPAAHAAILDFSSGTFSAQSANGLINRYQEDGFTVRTQSVAGAFEPALGSFPGQLRWFIDGGFVSNNVIVIERGGASFDLLGALVVAGFQGLRFDSSKGGAQVAGGANNAVSFDGDPWRGITSVTITQTLSARILNIVDDVQVQATPIPEPRAAALILAGLGALAFARRRISAS